MENLNTMTKQELIDLMNELLLLKVDWIKLKEGTLHCKKINYNIKVKRDLIKFLPVW